MEGPGLYSILPESLLEFGGTPVPQKHSHAEAGLKKFGPFDLALSSAFHPTVVEVDFIAPDAHLKTVSDFLSSLNRSRAKTNSKDRIGLDYPGARKSFRTDIKPAAIEEMKGLLPQSRILEALQRPMEAQGFDMMVALYEEALERVRHRAAGRPVVCFIPPEVEQRFWSTGKWRPGSKLIEEPEPESPQLELWSDETFVPIIERKPTFQDFRRCLKACGLRRGVITQLLRTHTMDPEDNDPAKVAWNFALGLYYKAGGIPWRCTHTIENVCHVGLSFGSVTYPEGKELLVGIAQVFNTFGEGLGVEVGQFNMERTDAGYYLSEQTATTLMSKALEYYSKSTGHLPHRVVLHKTTPFKQEEISGCRSALKGVPWVDMLHIQEDPPHRLLAVGKYPPKRGTFFPMDTSGFLLYSTGFLEEFRTYEGVGIPVPLLVRRYSGETDLRTLAEDILRMTKMNWNSLSYASRIPVTVTFARKILEILKYRRTNDPIVNDLRFYV